jgi:hypothetical protein
MKTFLVWDHLNGSQETAVEVLGVDAEDAAMMYAQDDSDGFSDGLYWNHREHRPNRQEIRVLDEGVVKRFNVSICEWEPVFDTEEIEGEDVE